jgi:hypothetical protein
MAKRKPNGEYVGIVGQLVLYEQRGCGVMRTRTPHRSDSSPLVADVRVSFGGVSRTLSRIKKLLEVGFENHTWSTAISVNCTNRKLLKNKGQLDGFRWLQFSGGKLSSAENFSAEITDAKKIKIEWNGTIPGSPFHDNDIVIILLYSSLDDEFYTFYPNGVTRSDGFALIDDYIVKPGDKIDVFAAFKVNTRHYNTKGNKNISSSEWVGCLES